MSTRQWSLQCVKEHLFKICVCAAIDYAFVHACLLCQKVLYDFRSIVTEHRKLYCCKQYAFIGAYSEA